MGVLAAETMTTGSFSMAMSSMFQVKVESLLGDFDSPGPVGPFLSEQEAVAFVEFARRIQSRERGEINALVPCLAAKVQSNAHESPAEPRSAVGVVDDEKPQPGRFERLGAIDGDTADDFIVLCRGPEAVALRIEARKELSQLACNFRFEVRSETPVAGVIATVQLDHAADAPRRVSADLHSAFLKRSRKTAPVRSASGGSRKFPRRSRRAWRRATGARSVFR